MARNILVTGGGTGIGRAVAARFVADADNVFITGRRAEPLKRTASELGGEVQPLVCDHTDPDQLAALLDELPERIDVLVNNAGGNTDFDRSESTGLAGLAATWRANLDANLLSAVLTTHAVRDRLGSPGAVVQLGSIAADKGAGSYGAAKAAVASWNIDLSRELGPRGITCNVVAPGYVADTEFFRDRLADQRRQTLIDQTATGRPGAPADIAATVHFLASPGARHITGQVLAVNGGAQPSR